MEGWRPILGYEGLYSVSDLGRVRSEDRVIVSRRRTGDFTSTIRGRIMKPWVNAYGYPVVSLCDAYAKVRKALVHRLVLLHFVGKCPEGFEGCHNNGCRSDAALSNLRWDSPRANNADKIAHGTDNRGEKNCGAKIDRQTALEIFHSKEAQRVVAKRYGISQGQVSRIRLGRKWQHFTAAA